MKGMKIALGLILLALGFMLLIGLVTLFQRLLISGSEMMNQLGNTVIVGEEDFASPDDTPAPDLDVLFSADTFDGEPVDTTAPEEELVRIPIEQTPEELAEENEASGEKEE